jgi:hypothetical protein
VEALVAQRLDEGFQLAEVEAGQIGVHVSSIARAKALALHGGPGL